MAPKVSIIIPIYNSEQYLNECLQSVALQTIEKELQVIMIDDGSTDQSADICKKYAEEFTSFEYHYKKNGGPATARNMGLNYAIGEYIGFIDSDDWVDAEMYERLFETASAHKADIVFCGVAAGENNKDDEYIKIRGGYYNRRQMCSEIFPYLLPSLKSNGYISSIRWSNPLRIIRREIIESNHIRSCEESMRAEDLTFLFRCTLQAQSYYYLDSLCTYHNRERTESVSTKYIPHLWNGYRKVFDELSVAAKDCHDYDFSNSLATTVFEFGLKSIENELQNKSNESESELDSIIKDSILQAACETVNHLNTCSYYKEMCKLILTKNPNAIIAYYKKQQRYTNYILPLYQTYLKLRKAIKVKQ